MPSNVKIIFVFYYIREEPDKPSYPLLKFDQQQKTKGKWKKGKKLPMSPDPEVYLFRFYVFKYFIYVQNMSKILSFWTRTKPLQYSLAKIIQMNPDSKPLNSVLN